MGIGCISISDAGNCASLPGEVQRKKRRENDLVRTWGYRIQQVRPGVQHRPVTLLRVLGQQQRSRIRPCLSRKEHIPAGEITVAFNQRPNPFPHRFHRRIPKMTSETNPCCPESLPSCISSKDNSPGSLLSTRMEVDKYQLRSSVSVILPPS